MASLKTKKIKYAFGSVVACCFFVFTNQSLAASVYDFFAEGADRVCGVKEFIKENVYKACRAKERGQDEPVDCGQHWTGWHGVGGGHGNPCPPGCYRTGSSMGTSYRSVGFPPRPQEKNKYQCLRAQYKSCQTTACGVERERQTGSAKHNTCKNPAFGLDTKFWEPTYGSASGRRKQVLDVIKQTAGVYSTLSPTTLPDNKFNDLGRVIVSYLDVAILLPDTQISVLKKLQQKLENTGANLTEEELVSILGNDLYFSLKTRSNTITYDCNTGK